MERFFISIAGGNKIYEFLLNDSGFSAVGSVAYLLHLAAIILPMKYFLPGLIWLLCAGLAVAQKEIHPCSAVKSKVSGLKSASLTPEQIAKTEQYDVHFYSLNLAITNTTTTLSGSVDMHAKTREATDTVWFELYPTLAITAIRLNGTAAPFTRMQSAIKVAANLPAGQNFVISTDYNGTPPNASTNPLGGGGMTNASSPTWGNQVTWSLSQPFSAYEWWPCKQSLRDKIDSVDVNITVPSTCKAGSNGLLKNVVVLPNNKTRYEWKHRHPIDYYLVSVSVAKYVEFSLKAMPLGAPDSVLIQNFVYDNPATLNQFRNNIIDTRDFIELFARLYGPYPFQNEKYGHCMAPIGGGMEHQTMTTQGSFSTGLTSHELAHQWFGNHVTCGSWADIWVNEGFATYSEYLTLENLYPGQEVAEMNNVHTSVMSQAAGSIWVEDSLNGDRIFSSRLSYDKGSAFIHMLRYAVNNDTLFFRALRKYQTRFADSTALGVDVKSVLEEESGKDLDALFEQWYFGEGYPTYSARWNTVNGDLHVKITHTVSAPLVTPTFTNPLEIKFHRTGMGDTTLRFDVLGNTSFAIVPGIGNVSTIASIDPKNWIVNKTGTTAKDPTLVITGSLDREMPGTPVLYPNPTTGKVRFGLNDPGTAQLHVLDPKGRLVHSVSIHSDATVDLSPYPAGTYLFQILTPSGQKTHRLVRKL